MSWFPCGWVFLQIFRWLFSTLPSLGRKVYFEVRLRKAMLLRSRRLAVKFRLARQIINYIVLQDFQFSWPGPALEVTGQFCTFQKCCGLISQQKYLNSVQVSDQILLLAFPPQHRRTSKPAWKRACISFRLAL